MKHSEALSIHKGAYVGSTDPSLDAANNVTPDKLWVDTTDDPALVLKVRNSADDGWIAVGGGGGGGWTEVTGGFVEMLPNKNYILAESTPLDAVLPLTAPVGSTIRVAGSVAGGGWKVVQNSGQQIILSEGGVDGTDETTIGATGSLESTDAFDSVELLCIVADTTWSVIGVKGTLTIT